MDRDELYYHFANLGLVLIGFLSIQSIFNPFVFMILMPGTAAGFLVSWHIKKSRVQHMDTFIGMLSLATIIIILGRLPSTTLSFESLLKIFSIALAWLMFFQSFGLASGNSYAMMQFISICFLVSSFGLALEGETFYTAILAIFLFLFIFTMRLNLLCEKKRKGSIIVGDEKEIMSLWQQIKVGCLMFSFVLIVASFLYPFVPRFENLSLRNIPSTLLGAPEQVPLLKLFMQAPKSVKDNKKEKKEQPIDDDSKKRETSGVREEGDSEIGKKEKDKDKKQITKRFSAKEFNKNIDIFKVETLTITSDKNEVPLDDECTLKAELKLNDGSIIPATRLVDWKVSGNADVSIDKNGNFVPREKGEVRISASYLGNFSNDIYIKIVKPVIPIKKKGTLYYLLIFSLYLMIIAILSFIVWSVIKSKKLSELASKDPKEFIKEVYATLCKAFKFYGVRKFDYLAYREFFELSKEIIPSKPEAMHLMTENLLEARFSTHEISVEHSQKMLELFHEVKEVVLEREERRLFFKNILFRVSLLNILMVPRELARG